MLVAISKAEGVRPLQGSDKPPPELSINTRLRRAGLMPVASVVHNLSSI